MSDPDARHALSSLASGMSGQLARIAAAMRAEGALVGVGELLSAHRALAAIDCSDRRDVRAALRAVMCSRREDLERFERAFLAAFGRDLPESHRDSLDALDALGEIERAAFPRAALSRAGLPGGGAPLPPTGSDPNAIPAAWSEVELLRHKDFAHYSDAEIAIARVVIARLARRGPMRPSRRTRPTRKRRHEHDLRRVLRASMRTGGEPVTRYWRAPSVRPRPVVLACDVSGSMEPYARMLLQYLHACVAARRRVEAFAFGTRLTRITNELAGRDHDRALGRASEAVNDFAGGTRIGAALAELNRVHGRRLGRGAVVVILSDGWDRGDPALLADEMARLARSAHRLVWLNPLAAHPAYEPLTRGMRAAVPDTDELLAGNSLGSLERLAAILEEM